MATTAQRLKALEAAVASLKTTTATLDTRVMALETATADEVARLTTAEREVGGLTTTVGTLEARVGALEGAPVPPPAGERLIFGFGVGGHEDAVQAELGVRPSRTWLAMHGIAPLVWLGGSVAVVERFRDLGGRVVLSGAWAHAAYGWPDVLDATLDLLADRADLWPSIAAVYLADEPDVADAARPDPAKVRADHEAVHRRLPGVSTLIVMTEPYRHDGRQTWGAPDYLPWCDVVGVDPYFYDDYATMQDRVARTVAVAGGRPVASVMITDPYHAGPQHGQPTPEGVRRMGMDALAAGAAHLGLWTSERGIEATLLAALPGITAAWRT
jgi:hypothetical protein